MEQTNFEEIAELSRAAQLIIGSDTGTMHLAGATQTPCLALFSGFSNPKKSRPWGNKVTVLQERNLKDLSSDIVLSKLVEILKVSA
jgi:ADP-heptose:LPS heptosyltransferase